MLIDLLFLKLTRADDLVLRVVRENLAAARRIRPRRG